MNPSSPQRLALDLQRCHQDLKNERERTALQLTEINHLKAALEGVQSSARRAIDSRLQAEEALNETEERLQLAAEAAGLALWDCRYPFSDVYLTARWGELIGDVALEGSWETTTLLKRIHRDDAPRMTIELRRLLDGETKRTSGEYRFQVQDEWIWLETHAMAADTDKEGRVTRLLGTHANVTPRKQLEEKGIRAREMAEQASRAKSEFLANMSHEVRTPLNAIMGLNELLLETDIDSEQRQWLGLINDSSRLLLNLLNDVLDLSRIEAGKLQLERINFPLLPLFENIFSIYAVEAHKKGVKLSLSMAPELPPQMCGDPYRVRQVLSNLLSNALKFTPGGGEDSMSVGVQHTNQTPTELVIKIVDNGIGIAPEQQLSIFDAFTQADASTARQFGGSGLGLAICSRLVKMMGGSITVNSSLGLGSTFEVRLPLTQATSMDHTEIPIPVEHLQALRAKFQKLRVIVAEDNSINEMLVCKILEKVGCEVRVARNGADAVRMWEEWAVELILMDVQMPSINGLMATMKIREAERKFNRAPTPILAFTANAMMGDRESYMAAGMTGYVAKPIEVQALFQAMTQALQKHEVPPEEPTSGERATLANATTLTPTVLSPVTQEDHPAPMRSNLTVLQQQIAEGPRRLHTALVQQDTHSAKAELERLRETFIDLNADRALRICRGLDMARHAGEWGLFSRALPLLQSEIDALLIRLDENAQVSPAKGSTGS